MSPERLKELAERAADNFECATQNAFDPMARELCVANILAQMYRVAHEQRKADREIVAPHFDPNQIAEDLLPDLPERPDGC